MTVPYTFGTATTSIPLSNLDANFNTPITLGNTSIYLGNTTTTIGNLTLTNATISSGTVNITNVTVTTANVTNITVTNTANIATGNITTLTSTSITDSGLTSGRVTFAGASGLLSDSTGFTFDGTYVNIGTGLASLNGLKFLANAGGLAASLNVNHSSGEIQNYANTNYFQTWYTNNTEKMRISTAGVVDIGVTGLTANANGAVGKLVLRKPNEALGNGQITRMLDFAPYYPGFDEAVVKASISSGVDTGTQNGQLGFMVATGGVLYEKIRLLANGNLGIGTSSPAFKTEIVGGATTVETTLFQIRSDAGGIGTGSTIAFANSTNASAGSGRVELAGIRDTTSGSSFVIRTADSVGTIQNRVKITETGLVGINIFTTPASGNANAKLVVKGTGASDVCEVQVTTNGALGFDFRNQSGTQVGSIAINAATTTYNVTSDYRLKNTVTPMTGALAKVALLKPVTYKWNADGSDGEGFIAHELAEVCPYAVTGAKDALDANGNIKPQGIDVSFLVATLTKAIQEQQALIESLTTRLTVLENK